MSNPTPSLEEAIDAWIAELPALYKADQRHFIKLHLLAACQADLAAQAAELDRRVVEGRLIELDLLEQAINAGRDMNAHKMQRLRALESQLQPAQNKGEGPTQ